jgi:uncharacterized protein (TIGR03435 family)
MDDFELLRQFAADGSQAGQDAFTALVERHLCLVHAAAWRQARDAHLAEEITQVVFILLARKAKTISRKTILTGWLYRTTHFVAADALKAQRRRQWREHQAAQMQTDSENAANAASAAADSAWEQIAPHLDEAMAKLGGRDRDAVLLRFFENKSFAQVGVALGVNEDAARKRIVRALEKLRRHFYKRGVMLTATLIAGAVSNNSVHAAPVISAKAISAIALAKGAAAGGSTLTLVKGALKLMAWTKAKTAIITGAVILLAAGTTTVTVKEIQAHNINWGLNSKALDQNPPIIILRPTQFHSINGGAVSGNKIVFENVPLRLLLATVYHHNEFRMVFPENYPKGNFDFMFTMSGNWPEALKAKIKKQFGLVAHTETRDADVLLAKTVNSDAPGLKVTSSNENQQIGNFRDVVFKGVQIDALTSWLEAITETPVIDETGLTNHYDITVKWKPKTGQTEADAIRQILPNQFGLELVPTNMPIEMLVVEKAP